MASEIDIVTDSDGNDINGEDQPPQQAQELLAALHFVIAPVLEEEESLQDQEAVKDGARHGGDGGGESQTAEEKGEEQSSGNGEEELELAVVPLDEVAVDLEASKIEEEVQDIAMEDPAGEDPPELVLISNTGIVLILELVEGTVPGDGALLGFRIAEDDERQKGDDVQSSESKGEAFEFEVGHQDGMQRRVFVFEEFVRPRVHCISISTIILFHYILQLMALLAQTETIGVEVPDGGLLPEITTLSFLPVSPFPSLYVRHRIIISITGLFYS